MAPTREWDLPPRPTPQGLVAGQTVSFRAIIADWSWASMAMLPNEVHTGGYGSSAATKSRATDPGTQRTVRLPVPQSLLRCPPELLDAEIVVEADFVPGGNETQPFVGSWHEDSMTSVVGIVTKRLVQVLLGPDGTIYTAHPLPPHKADLYFPTGGAAAILEFKNMNSTNSGTWIGFAADNKLSRMPLDKKNLIQQVGNYATHAWKKVHARPHTEQPAAILLGAGIVPFHLFQMWFPPDCETVVIAEDALPFTDQPNPYSLTPWTAYYQDLTWWMFVSSVNLSEQFRQRWSSICPEAVRKADEIISAVGEALATGTAAALLTTFIRSAHFVQAQLSYRLLKHCPRSLTWSLARKLFSGANFELVLDDRPPYAFMTFHLPTPDRYECDDRHEICLYPSLDLVIKIFMKSEEDSYQAEKKFYKVFADWQGNYIPVLHGTGRRADDGSPFLIISYEGEPVGPLLSQEEISCLERNVVSPMHQRGWHHHDLSSRNIVRNKSGKLVIIDFGLAVEGCGEGDGCALDALS